ncbi:ATPase P [Faecalibacterium sp. An77]|uniref:ATPase P n=1 Tax=unclassified Faecalibacterium TaxID=2646395 RepID=UPI000B3679AD|nr:MULTISPECIES: ATPase P [unclassified Faecalibacterium]OUN37383.1 ATPase P [Faecalibacterium sp. An77]OUP27233.1 ATPase P [Faecalibacterium sp. An192]
MIFKPVQLGREALDPQTLAADKKSCRRIGPCGVGDKALYLNSFYLDRRYYVTYPSITRAFKRVAMSRGGFTQKGVFASIPYLVVQYDNGKEKQCNFKYEEQVDQLLDCLAKTHPEIKRVSAAAEERLAQRERERAARKKPNLSPEAQKSIRTLEQASDYLTQKPELAQELSLSAKRKRAYLCSKPSYRWVALAITLLGVASLIFGVTLFAQGSGSFGAYFALFGLAAIFMFSGASVLPTAQNNKKVVMGRADRALQAMEDYLRNYDSFPVPARYAHPIVLQRMIRVLEEGRAVHLPEALEAVKQELKSLNSDVEVDQEEYDEVVAIKPMFLNENYR